MFIRREFIQLILTVEALNTMEGRKTILSRLSGYWKQKYASIPIMLPDWKEPKKKTINSK